MVVVVVWSVFQMRDEPAIDSVQDGGYHMFLRLSAPERNCSWEECFLPVICSAGGDVIAAVVVLHTVS